MFHICTFYDEPFTGQPALPSASLESWGGEGVGQGGSQNFQRKQKLCAGWGPHFFVVSKCFSFLDHNTLQFKKTLKHANSRKNICPPPPSLSFDAGSEK